MAYKSGLLTTEPSPGMILQAGNPYIAFLDPCCPSGTWMVRRMTTSGQLQAAEEALQRLGLAPEEEAGRQLQPSEQNDTTGVGVSV